MLSNRDTRIGYATIHRKKEKLLQSNVCNSCKIWIALLLLASISWAQFVGAGSEAPCRGSKGDGVKRVPSEHNAEGISDPQSSTEARAGHGSAQNAN